MRYSADTILKRLFLTAVIFFAAGNAHAKPLLIAGEGNADITAAFSYDFLSSPLRKPFFHGEGKVTINLPVNVARPINSSLRSWTDEYMVIPEFTASAQQAFNTSIDISSPMFGGAGFFAIRENAGLEISGAIGNTGIDINDTSETGEGLILVSGNFSIPLTFSMYWRTITFGYTIHPAEYIRIGFQIHRHSFSASTAGNLKSTMFARFELTGDEIFSADIPFSEDKIFGSADGFYEGYAWSPEIGIQIGPLSIVSRMGLEINAEGYLESAYQIPFFIDEDTFIPKFTEIDSFSTPENIKKMLNTEMVSKSYRIDDRLIIKVPQSHTIAFDFVKDRIYLSYTKVFGKLQTYTVRSGNSSNPDYFDTGNYLNASLSPDHILLLTSKTGWFRHNIGFNTFDVGYRNHNKLYSKLLDDKVFGMGPVMPVWNLGFQTGIRKSLVMDFYIFPIPAVRTGFHYVF